MKSLRYLALGVLVWAGLSVSAFASTEQTSFAATFPVTCPDGRTELIAVDQTQTVDSTISFDSNGGMHWNMHTRWAGTGVGLISGATYQTGGSRTLVENVAVDQTPFVMNWSFTTRYIGQATAPNIFVVTREHSTVNANGETTSDFSVDSVTCH